MTCRWGISTTGIRRYSQQACEGIDSLREAKRFVRPEGQSPTHTKLIKDEDGDKHDVLNVVNRGCWVAHFQGHSVWEQWKYKLFRCINTSPNLMNSVAQGYSSKSLDLSRNRNEHIPFSTSPRFGRGGAKTCEFFAHHQQIFSIFLYWFYCDNPPVRVLWKIPQNGFQGVHATTFFRDFRV